MRSPASERSGGRFQTLRLLFFSLSFLLAALVTAEAQNFPPLTGRVVDQANILSPADKAELDKTLADFEARSSDQIVVAIVNSLDGSAIEPYANQLFRFWKLGQTGENNGVLMLIANSDRKMRIEVGYGLEGTLTDLHSKLIIENALVPAFRDGEYGAGIKQAVSDIIQVLDGESAEMEARYKRNASESTDYAELLSALFFFAIFGVMILSFLLALLARMFGRKIGPNKYQWLGMTFAYGGSGGSGRGGWSGGGGGWSSGGGGGGGFSGGGGSSGGGGASGSW